MSSLISTLDRVNIDAITSKPPRAFGAGNKAKGAWLEHVPSVSTPNLPQAFNIRATDDTAETFSVQMRLDKSDPSSETFAQSLKAFDQRIRKLAFEHKNHWFSKNVSSEISTEADLRQLHHPSISKGAEKPDGTFYDDSVKFKIAGWGPFVEEVLYKGEGEKRYISDVKWKSRLVNAMGFGGPEENQTKFFLSQGKDMATGKEKMVAKVPCQDPAGNHLKDANNNLIWEFVGPKHAQPGSKLTVVFEPKMVWIAAKFGVSFTARQIFITPAPPKPRNVVEGIEIVDYVDPIMAIRAVQLATAGNDVRDLEQDDYNPEQDSMDDASASLGARVESIAAVDAVPAECDTTGAAAEAGGSSPSTKKRTSKASSSDGAAKKKKSTTLDDEF